MTAVAPAVLADPRSPVGSLVHPWYGPAGSTPSIIYSANQPGQEYIRLEIEEPVPATSGAETVVGLMEVIWDDVEQEYIILPDFHISELDIRIYEGADGKHFLAGEFPPS